MCYIHVRLLVRQCSLVDNFCVLPCYIACVISANYLEYKSEYSHYTNIPNFYEVNYLIELIYVISPTHHSFFYLQSNTNIHILSVELVLICIFIGILFVPIMVASSIVFVFLGLSTFFILNSVIYILQPSSEILALFCLLIGFTAMLPTSYGVSLTLSIISALVYLALLLLKDRVDNKYSNDSNFEQVRFLQTIALIVRTRNIN